MYNTNTPDKLSPLLHCHYSNINATTRQSASTTGFGTQTLRVFHSWSLPWHPMVSSHVPTTQPPYRSCHLYAGCRSDNKQVTSELIPHSLHKHGFDITHCISTHHQWFPYGHLLYGHLTVHHCLLNVSFTTLTLSGESSIHRFATSSCKAIARDLLSSVSQLRM